MRSRGCHGRVTAACDRLSQLCRRGPRERPSCTAVPVLLVLLLAAPCSPTSLLTPLHGRKECSRTGGDFRCTLSCDDGYVFYDYPDEETLNYTCSAGSAWNAPNIPACASTGNEKAVFREVYRFLYTSSVDIPTACQADYVARVNEKLTGALRNVVNQECGANKFTPAVTGTVDLLSGGVQVNTANRKQLFISYTIRHDDAPRTSHQLCSAEFEKLETPSYSLFRNFSEVRQPIDCPEITASVGATRTESGYVCSTGKRVSYKNEEICISCPEGTYSDDNNCTLCSKGSYRSNLALRYCEACPPNTESPAGAVSQSQCLAAAPVLSAQDVLAQPGQTATLSWTLPDLTGVAVLVIFNSSNKSASLSVLPCNNEVFSSSFDASRFTYLGDTTQSNVTFTLSDVSTGDAGSYLCGRDNFDDVLPNCGQRLVVLGPPTKPVISSDAAIVEGDDVTLTCNTTSTSLPPDHNLTLTYTWVREGVPLPGVTSRSLLVRNVSRHSTEQYTCQATESRGMTSETSDAYVMDVLYGPESASLQPSNSSYQVREGREALPSIRCLAECRPPCSFRWTGLNVSSNGASFPLTTATRGQAGLFTCTASNRYDRQQTFLSLSVSYPPEVRLQVSGCSAASTYPLLVGDPLPLTCDVTDAYPRANLTFQWSLPGSVWEAGGTQRQLTVTRSSGGQYACRASNSVGASSSSSLTVEVQYPPQVRVSPSQVQVREGGAVEVECSVEARPAAPAVWSRQSGRLPPGLQASSPTLTLPNVSRSDSGLYTCSASNTLSPCHGPQSSHSHNASVSIDVLFVPAVTSFTVNDVSNITVDEGAALSIRCDVTSNPPSRVSVLNVTSGRVVEEEEGVQSLQLSLSAECLHAGRYSCSASNSVGSSPPRSPVLLHVRCSPREDPRVHGIHTTRASVLGGNVTFTLLLVAFPSPQHLWYRQDNNGSGDGEPILGAGASSSGGTASLTVTSVQQRDFGLYFLNVSNSVGQTSFTFSLVTKGPPECPRLLNVSSHLSRPAALTVSWERGFNNGGVQHFLVEVREGAGQWRNSSPQVGESALQDRYSLTLDTSSLQPGTDLALRVRAYNQFGASCYSGEGTGRTPRAEAGQQGLGQGGVIAVSVLLPLLTISVVVIVILVWKWRARSGQYPRQPEHIYESAAFSGHAVQVSNSGDGGEYGGLELATRSQPRDDSTYQQLVVYQNQMSPDRTG